jgi:hypothetical protein
MEYVEFLRVRGLAKWPLICLGAGLLLALLFGHSTTVSVNGTDGSRIATVASGMSVPLAALAPVAMFFAAIFGSIIGTSLNREYCLRDIAWTKPLPRSAVALRYLLIDAAGIVLMYLLGYAVLAAIMLRISVTPVVDDTFVPQLLLGGGVALMWFALIQLLTCLLPPAGMSISGILWPVALFALGLADVPNVTGTIARAFDVINPLAYMSGVSSSGGNAVMTSLWHWPVEERTLVVCGFAVLFCGIAIAVWPRREG